MPKPKPTTRKAKKKSTGKSPAPSFEPATDAERPHHPFSPSSLALREACACYESRGGTSEAAERGSMQHAAVELGEDNDDMADYEALAVVQCLEYCDDLQSGKYAGRVGCILKEPYLPVDSKHIKIDGEKHLGTTAGYCDFAIISDDETEADIVDWKFGMFAVKDAQYNIQGQAYALGLRHLYPKLKSITVHFVAPHRDEISFHEFQDEDMDWCYVRVTRAVKGAIAAKNKTLQGDFSDATPDATACLFCKHLGGNCPVLTQKMIDIGLTIDPLQLPEDLTVEVCNDPKNAGIGLRLAAVVKNWAEGYRTFISNKTVDELDYVPDGYVLVSSQRREVKSVRGVRELAEEYNVTQEEIDGASSIALGKLEGFIKSKAPRGVKELTVEEFSQACEEAGYIEKGAPFGYLKMAKGVKK